MSTNFNYVFFRNISTSRRTLLPLLLILSMRMKKWVIRKLRRDPKFGPATPLPSSLLRGEYRTTLKEGSPRENHTEVKMCQFFFWGTSYQNDWRFEKMLQMMRSHLLGSCFQDQCSLITDTGKLTKKHTWKSYKFSLIFVSCVFLYVFYGSPIRFHRDREFICFCKY